jgi:hypothetical protein
MTIKRLITFSLVVASLTLAPIVGVWASSSTTLVVTPVNLQGWQPTNSGTAQPPSFVEGPGTPPLPTGSAQLEVGSDGDSAAQLRHPGYAGTKLSDLTSLSYSTYVQQTGSGGQAPYILLNIDTDNNGSIDDQLFFEPVYQTGTYSGDTVPDQCAGVPGCVATGQWQTWDALEGGWWSLNAFTFGPPLVTLDTYITANPDARIVNSVSGLGGLRIVTGFGNPAWNNFKGNVDAFTIGVNNVETVYNFEQYSAPSNKAQCKDNGWQTFNPNRPAGPFKNQGDCVQFAITGK